MLTPLLFNKMDIYSVVENQKAAMRKAINSAPKSDAPDDEVLSTFISQFSLNVPVLDEAAMTSSEKEIDLDVSHDSRRMFMSSGPFYVRGTELTIHIPFSGEAVLFQVRPNAFSLSPPRGIIDKNELRLQYTFANDSPPPNLKHSLDSDINSIKGYLEHLRESAKILSSELGPIASQAWQQRKAQFTSTGQVISGLGIPQRSAANLSSVSKSEPSVSKSRAATIPAAPPDHNVQHSWKVFISHASEDKEAIAKPLADALRKSGLSVWYDDYTLKVGDSLRQKIDEGLSQSEFGIVILSNAFFAKHWPQQELNGLAARESHGKRVILPVWHDISRDEVTNASPMLADRLGVPTTLGIEQVVMKLLKAMN